MAQPFKHPISGIYYLRIKVPANIRDIAGKAEYKRSLRTKNLNEARSRYPQALIECQQVFERHSAQLAGKLMFSEAEAVAIADDWFSHERDHVERTKTYTSYLSTSGSGVCGPDGDEYEDYETLRDGLTEYEECNWIEDVIDPIVDAHLRKLGHPIPSKKSTEMRWFRESFDVKVNELSTWALGRQEGNIPLGSCLPASPTVQTNSTKSTLTKSHSVSAVFASFKRDRLQTENASRAIQKTLAEYASAVAMFVELHGDLAIHEVSRVTVTDHRRFLAQLPSSGKGIRGMAATELIKKAEIENLPKLTEATIKKRLTAISSVFSHAHRLGWINENPIIASQLIKITAKAAQKKRAQHKKKKDFTRQEVAKIFSSSIFSTDEAKHGLVDFGEAWKWVPILLYYTGCRREEVAQLKAKEVIQQDGHWCLDILKQGEDEGRGVKNAGSRRIIPLHQDVIQRGFIEYVKGLPTDGPLFPKLLACTKGFYGTNFGKNWSKYLRTIVQLKSDAAPLHGFRHTFKTLSRSVGIPEDIHDAITGHSGEGNTVARLYGTMPPPRVAEELTKYPTIGQLISEASEGL